MWFKYLREPTPSDVLASGEAFHYFENGMSCLGWIPPARYEKIYKILAIFFFVWTVYYVPTGIIFSFVLDMEHLSPSELLTVLQLFVNACGSPFKVFFLKTYLWRFQRTKELFGQMDERCSTLVERFEIHRWVVRCNRAYLMYESLYVGYGISTFLSAVLSGGLPWRIYTPFVDWRQSLTSYWICVLHETILMLFAVSQNVLIDVYSFLCGIMLKVHITLLIKRVERLCTDPEKSDEENLKDLVDCIEDHKLIKECAQMIRPVIAGTIFVQFLLIGVSLGFSMINLFFFADLWAALATLAYIIGLIMQTFPFCFVCDLIKADCELLQMAIFHSNWLDSSKKYKTSLILFLMNAQQSIVFTAGKIFPITTNTNVKVAKLAFSVVTLVNQFNLAEKLATN
ncbi:odorant receptor 98a-like [Drosophila eugracilis]|uniref:odorant receptor 98a-like n=1 Tax=Drosophila eugracilis TaxID=29029 RepID=UPI001BDB2D23|nr:odorant receptor 98a-like [Drosophila eugracilis]